MRETFDHSHCLCRSVSVQEPGTVRVASVDEMVGYDQAPGEDEEISVPMAEGAIPALGEVVVLQARHRVKERW